MPQKRDAKLKWQDVTRKIMNSMKLSSREKKYAETHFYKTCSKCEKCLLFEEFSNVSKGRYRKNSMCKDCFVVYMKKANKKPMEKKKRKLEEAESDSDED